VREVNPGLLFFENVANHLHIGFDLVARELQEMGYRVAAGLFTAAEVGATHKRERLFILADNSGTECDGWRATAARSERIQHASECRKTVAHSHSHERSADQGQPDTGSNRWDHLMGCGATVAQSRRVPSGRGTGRGEAQEGRTLGQPAGPDIQLGDPNNARLEGRRQPILERPDQLPAWPPGPENCNAWTRVLVLDPSLEPALCRMAHGVADRVDRLRACGNGVVPAQAAYAFVTLYRELMEEEAA
jgi:DNA (cytosine-5)-methyltransferase 1